VDRPDSKHLESQLKRLERRNTASWVLAALVLVSLGAALVSMKMTGITTEDILAGDSGYVLLVGVAGLVVLFALYMLHKQSQIQGLRAELYQAMVLQESLRSRLSGLSTLFEGVAQVGVQFDLEAMLQTLTDHVRSALHAERSSLLLLDADTRELRCVAVVGRNPEPVRASRVKAGEGIAGHVVEKGEPLALTPEIVTRRFATAAHPARDIRGGLCVPLALPDQVIGVLNVTRIENPEPFTEEDARMVTVFAAHIAIAIRRVNERRQAQDVLREHEEQNRQSQKMESLGRLAGGVAHDFNNLLTVILSYGAKLLRGLAPADPMRQCAEKITDAADRCASLTRQLLTFSRKQVVEARVLDLNECVGDMSELLRRLIGENVELVTQLDPAVARIRADRHQLEQVLMNLVVNACDALPLAGRVTISTSNVALDPAGAARHAGARPGDYAVLTVRDTGHGMDAETQAHVFEPFFTTKEQGTGLGLSTVYGVVQQSGGFISIESKPGQGTTFRIHFPKVEAGEATVPVADTSAPGRRGGATILLVEDEADVRELVRDLLETHGYQVLVAEWAGEAVMLNETHVGDIDLMLTDVVMPGESGGQLAQWMAQARPDMPVLYMSGYTDDAIVRHGVQNDGAAFLQKPFTEEALLQKVDAMLASSAARAAAPQRLDRAA
jgi:signal transduction histidine kinase/ActR/RegA family two-component response regulator